MRLCIFWKLPSGHYDIPPELVANNNPNCYLFPIISAESSKLFRFASLSKYSPGKRLAIHLADRLFYFLIYFIGSTTRFETEAPEHLRAIEEAGRLPIYATWHDRIFLGTYYLKGRGIVFLTSQSFDGEYIARFLQRFGFGTVRGSSSRGGSRALVEMIREMKRGNAMGFTVDGPRGPRYVAKSGAVLLARKTGEPILPFIIEPLKFFSVNSWDKLQVPRPWSRALVIFGKPIHVGTDGGDEELTSKLSELQDTLEGLAQRGGRWRESQ